jgi:5-methylthioadenosine/S-adenosylhomocysteine deaminase
VIDPATSQHAAVRRLVADVVVPITEPGFIRDAGIDIDAAGRIVAVGPITDLGPAPGAVERVGGLLMPGLVNAHAHTPMTLVRSAGDGLPLQRWLAEGVWPREGKITYDDARIGMLLGSGEMLLAGVTTSCEMYLHEEALLDAVEQSGARAVITPGVVAALAPGGVIDGRLDLISEFHRAHHGDHDGRVTAGFGPHSLYDLAPEQVGAIVERAAEVDALVHIHLDETRSERDLVIERWGGRTATRILADMGALEGRLLGAHGVWLDDDDLRLLGGAGAGIAHCPQSNLKLGSGIAPLVAMQAAGITVGVATDGPASNDDLDLWEEMKLAPLLARGRELDPRVIDVTNALRLATVDAARAIGLGDVGELRPGAVADIIRIDLDQPVFTPGIDADLLAHLVFAGSSHYVTDVWVNGERVVKSGVCTTVDMQVVMREVRTRGARLAT